MPTTINVANIKIGLDTEELKKNGAFTRAELTSISRLARESIDPFEKYASEIDKLQRAYAAGGLSAERFANIQEMLARKLGVSIPSGNLVAYNQGMEQLRKRLADGAISVDEFQKAQKKLQQQLGETTKAVNDQKSAASSQQSAISAVKGLVATYVGLSAAISGIKASVKIAAEAETTKVAFGVLVGSTEHATKILKDFKELDVQSPIAFGDFAKAGKTMLQFGVDADQLKPVLGRLSAISLGNSEQFQSLALAFGQVRANGRLMGQEVLQMVNAGFNPLQEISRTTGISMIELKKQMEAGAISAEMVAKAFETATNEGGRFYGMNQQLEKTMTGQFAKLEGEMKAASVTLGNSLIPLVMQLTGLMKDFAEGANSKEKSLGGGIAFNMKLIAEGWGYLVAVARGKGNEYLDALDDLKEAELDAAATAKKAEWDRINGKKTADEEAKALAIAAAKRAEEETARLKGLEKDIERNKDVGKSIWSLREEYDKLTLGEEKALEAAQKRKGWTENDIEMYRKFALQVDELRKAKEREREASKIKEDLATPQEKLQKELQRLEELRAMGPEKGLSQEQFDQMQQKAVERFSIKSDVVSNIAPAIKAGTTEAYKFLVENQEKNRHQEEMKRIQEDMLKEARTANELNRNAPRLARMR